MRRLMYKILLVMLLLATPLIGYFWHYHALSVRLMEQKNIDGEKANTIKHAYAAAQLFHALSAIIPDDDAQKMVLWLGRMNEHAEQRFHAYPKNLLSDFKADTTIEIIKDLQNNIAGITAARWQAQHMPKDFPTLDMIVRLADTDAVVVWANRLAIPQKELDAHANNVAFAHGWVEERNEEIVANTQKALAELY